MANVFCQANCGVVLTTPKKISMIVAKLKSLHLGHDVEVHLVGSNVSYKAKQDFYVRVKLLEEESEQLKCIVDGLMKLGIFRDQIWTSIINDFIPAEKMI